MRAADRRPWRVAITRGEPGDGPLSTAVRRAGLTPASCPVLIEGPPDNPQALREAAARLARYDWLVCASRRSVAALRALRPEPWPAGLRSAAVGPATAAALVDYGATPPPVTTAVEGADALWSALEDLDAWPDRTVLVLTTPGGRSTLADGLRAAGATVDLVEAYRMIARPLTAIRASWAAAAPDAAVLASPQAARTLTDAIGRETLSRLSAVIAIGPTTASALNALRVPCTVASDASFDAAAGAVARLWAGDSGR